MMHVMPTVCFIGAGVFSVLSLIAGTRQFAKWCPKSKKRVSKAEPIFVHIAVCLLIAGWAFYMIGGC